MLCDCITQFNEAIHHRKCYENTRTVPERCITPLAGLSHECYYETAEVHQQVIA